MSEENLLTVIFTEVEAIPADAFRCQRQSDSSRALDALRASASGVVEVSATSRSELERFYRSLVQFRSRHPEEGLGIRKAGDRIYLWVDKTDAAPTAEGLDVTM